MLQMDRAPRSFRRWRKKHDLPVFEEFGRKLLRYINDNADKARLNVRFDKDPEHRLARVIALRPLAAGEELFVSYGAGYWKQHPGVFTASS